MEQSVKAAIAGDLVQQLLTGDIKGAMAKAAQLVQDGIARDKAGFAMFVDSVAERMTKDGGDLNSILIMGSNTLNDSLSKDQLANVVLDVAIERAREINRQKALARPYGVKSRPIRDNPQA